MHIVTTYGEPREVIDYLEFNNYTNVKHLIGKLYACKLIGYELADVKVFV